MNIIILFTLIEKVNHDETEKVMLQIWEPGTIQFGGKWFVTLLLAVDLRK